MTSEKNSHGSGWAVSQGAPSPGRTDLGAPPAAEGSSGPTSREAAATDRPLSAPPPGFNPDSDGKPNAAGDSEFLWSGQNDALQAGSGRTSSFKNLADAVGSGLAELMHDSTMGEDNAALLSDNFFHDPNHNSQTRQSRHGASHLVGSGQSRDALGNQKAADAGSLFTSFDSEKSLPKQGNGPAGSFSDYSKGFSRQGEHGTGVPGTFSGDSSDRLGNYRAFQPNAGYDDRSRLPPTAVEAGTYGREPAGRGAGDVYGLQQGMQSLWSDRDSPYKPNTGVGGPPSASSGTERQVAAEEELRPFTWDVRHPDVSRTLAIMHAGGLPANEVKSVCEPYGSIESFRSDFVAMGVFFVSYYDMRAAQFAGSELQLRLQQLGQQADRVLVRFCVPLNSSSENDDSQIVLMDVPMDLNVDSLAYSLSAYGDVRSLKSLGGKFGVNSFMVEYHNIQDAKQALLELESSQQFGPNVSVECGARNQSDRKHGRELLALIRRWRQGGSESGGANPRQPSASPDVGRYGQNPPRGTAYRADGPGGQGRYDMGHSPGREPAPQLVLGPDGRYTYMVVNHGGYPPQGAMPPQYGDRVIRSNHGTTYVTHVNSNSPHQYWQPPPHHYSSSGSVVSQSSYPDSHHSGQYPSGTQSLPYFRGDGASSVGSHSHRMSVPGPSSASSAGGGNNQDLVLDLDAVEDGRDQRTSLMVRNIPNKYTQQMLLNEFEENGHGPGVIDFFYLPIDFKNRCNRGYAFINFVDNRDILQFHRRYFGNRWRTFNSDKICDITYARIQGKSAMLKRFENSALMEKDDEYKPLVFSSHGPDKGTRLPFPRPSS